MSLRSKIIEYYLDEDNEQNSDMDEAVEAIVLSDLNAKSKFAESARFSQLVSLGHVAMSMISKLVNPDSKADFQEVPEFENLETKLLLEAHANTRELLVDSFFEDENKRSSGFVKMYCNDDLKTERGSTWNSVQSKLMSLAMKTLVWYGEFAMSMLQKRKCNPEKPNFEEHEFKFDDIHNLVSRTHAEHVNRDCNEHTHNQNVYLEEERRKSTYQELPPLSDLLEELKGEETAAKVANSVLSE
jgi:hypothetical protein